MQASLKKQMWQQPCDTVVDQIENFDIFGLMIHMDYESFLLPQINANDESLLYNCEPAS